MTRHHIVEAVAFVLEGGSVGFERAAARQPDTHRIDEAAVDQNFVMQMRAGRQAGRADKADDLALAHAHARLDALGEGGHVAVGRFITVGVAKLDVFAVAAFPADLVDHAVAGGEDRRAVRSGPVDAGMHLHVAEDRVAATPKSERMMASDSGLRTRNFFALFPVSS